MFGSWWNTYGVLNPVTCEHDIGTWVGNTYMGMAMRGWVLLKVLLLTFHASFRAKHLVVGCANKVFAKAWSTLLWWSILWLFMCLIW